MRVGWRRSSYRNGKNQSRSPAVVRPYSSKVFAREFPTPLRNRSGVSGAIVTQILSRGCGRTLPYVGHSACSLPNTEGETHGRVRNREGNKISVDGTHGCIQDSGEAA